MLKELYGHLRGGSSPEVSLERMASERRDRPWEALAELTPFARASWSRAPAKITVSPKLTPVREGGVAVEAGEWLVLADRARQRAMGAFDSPREIARWAARVAWQAEGSPASVGDPMCGVGAMLLAASERGVQRLFGADLDGMALALAKGLLPGAELWRADVFSDDPAAHVQVVLTNPPFVPPERQDRPLRKLLTARHDWLSGRFDLCVPAADAALSWLGGEGTAAVVLPAPLLTQRYARGWRRRWLSEHGLHFEPSRPFPGVSAPVFVVRCEVGKGPSVISPMGVSAERLLRRASAPLDLGWSEKAADLADRVVAAGVRLDTLCRVDTGVVSHGPLGGKARLVRDVFEPGAVPYADAAEFFRGERRWLLYRPEEMHRPKARWMFEGPKIVVQRVRGAGPVRAAVDRTGTYLGHTATVICPLPGPETARVPLERLCDLLTDPLCAGWLRVQHGVGLDLYPKDLASLPVPSAWLDRPQTPLQEAWGLEEGEARLLRGLAPASPASR